MTPPKLFRSRGSVVSPRRYGVARLARVAWVLGILILPREGSARPSPLPRPGQDTTHAHPSPAPRLGTLRPLLGTFHLLMTRRQPGDSFFRPFGTVTVIRDSTRLEGEAVLRNVASYDWGGGRTTLDSTLSLVGTVAPLSERTRTPARIVAYDLHGLRATGRLGPFDSLRPIDDRLPAPAFNSTDLDMLVTALRLGGRFEAELPLYDPEFPGYRMATLRVTGSTRLRTAHGDRDVWLLSIAEPGRPDLHYRVDQATHRLWEKTFELRDGTSFRIRDAELREE